MAALSGSWPNVGTFTENDNINVSSDVDPSTNVEENDNLSCLEAEIINEDNLFNVDSDMGLDNHKTFNILGQERNDFWYPPGYILDLYRKISKIHLNDEIIKENNDKFAASDDVACGPPFFMLPKFPNNISSSIKESPND